jgi:hypothetical protein
MSTRALYRWRRKLDTGPSSIRRVGSRGPPRIGLIRVVLRRGPANYRCSLGTNTVLGLVTNGLLAVSRDGGPEN